MKIPFAKSALLILSIGAPFSALTAGNDPNNPTWWDKYTYLAKNGPVGDGSTTGSITSGTNVDLSNECGPQSETFITLDTRSPKHLAAGRSEERRVGKEWRQ